MIKGGGGTRTHTLASYRYTMATSIVRRPLDLFIVIVFAALAVIGITIDLTQALYGSALTWEEGDYGVWPPAFLLDQYIWWCKEVDPLLAYNPLWYSTMAMYGPFIYTPFYVVAIYAFIFEKEWIRVPTLMWGWGLVMTLIPIVRENLEGDYQTKDLTLFLLAYGPYILMPVLIMLRVACTPVFSSGKNKSE